MESELDYEKLSESLIEFFKLKNINPGNAFIEMICLSIKLAKQNKESKEEFFEIINELWDAVVEKN